MASSTRRSNASADADQQTTTAPNGDGDQPTASASAAADRGPTDFPAAGEAAAVTSNPLVDHGTRLDDFNDAPSTVQPGDAPADTKDPSERATTVGGDKRAAAMAGHQTVNAAVPVDPEKFKAGLAISSAMADGAQDGDGEGGRWEEYDLTAPDGTVKHVRRNLDTGEHDVS